MINTQQEIGRSVEPLREGFKGPGGLAGPVFIHSFKLCIGLAWRNHTASRLTKLQQWSRPRFDTLSTRPDPGPAGWQLDVQSLTMTILTGPERSLGRAMQCNINAVYSEWQLVDQVNLWDQGCVKRSHPETQGGWGRGDRLGARCPGHLMIVIHRTPIFTMFYE